MNVLVFGANWFNRGDEAAIRSMVDEIEKKGLRISYRFAFNQHAVMNIPICNERVYPPYTVEDRKKHPLNWVAQHLLVFSNGKINLLTSIYRKRYYDILNAVKWADCAIFAPGGPCIGDIYHQYFLLVYMDMMRRNGVPYFFYAPSMGPFTFRSKSIRRYLNLCDILCVREALSAEYIERLGVKKHVNITLDSALQHDIEEKEYVGILENNRELKDFIESSNRIVGITITHLQWNSLYKGSGIDLTISKTFQEVVKVLTENGIRLIFIPQQFGMDNDMEYMGSFANDKCYILSDKYDCYFQQYLISKLYAVIGMRYHSNVFSAKMGVPFLAISYEQKTKGFMKECGLSEYCLDIKNLNTETVIEYFKKLENNYELYRKKLICIHDELRQKSYRTTEMLVSWLKRLADKKNISI